MRIGQPHHAEKRDEQDLPNDRETVYHEGNEAADDSRFNQIEDRHTSRFELVSETPSLVPSPLQRQVILQRLRL